MDESFKFTVRVHLQMKSKMGIQEWHVTMFNVHLQSLLGSTVLDIMKSREMTKQTDWQAQNPLYTYVAHALEVLKCWGAWDTTCRPKTKERTSYHLFALRRKAQKKTEVVELAWKGKIGPLLVSPALEPFCSRNTWEMGCHTYVFSLNA